MCDRCVVSGRSNIPDAEKGVALHKIPFYGDDRSEAKARKKKWMDFVRLKHNKWTPNASSALCSCHLAPENFTRRQSFGNLKCKRTLIKDKIGQSFSAIYLGRRFIRSKSSSGWSCHISVQSQSFYRRCVEIGYFNFLFFFHLLLVTRV